MGRNWVLGVVAGTALVGCAPTDEAEVNTATEGSSSSSGGSTGTTDPGSSTSGDDGSSSSSTGPQVTCGDGIVEGDEACDDGPDNGPTAACLDDCTAASCGDGNVQEGVEACDDGNDDDADDCTSACTVASCGDGFVHADEECDNGEDNGDSRACKSDCTAATCGDGTVHNGEEQCDDANDDNNDGCNELCQFSDCGDGFWNPEINEICDDGPGTPGDSCNDDCLTWGLWTETYNGPASSNDLIRGLAFDGSGNVVAVGETLAPNGNGDDVWIRKYNPMGGELWTQTHHGVTSDIGYGVSVAPNDDIFVVGSSFTLDDGRDVWLRRYGSDGSPGFTRTHNGSSNDADEGLGVATDGAGNVGVVGYVTQGGDREIFIRKYSPTGTTLWTVVEAASGNDDQGHGVAFDGAGNLVATGFVAAGGGENIWVGKYDTNGNELWTRTHQGAGGGNDRGQGAAVDSNGDIVIAGFEAAGGGESDNAWLRKYDGDGTEQWTVTFNGPSDSLDRAHAVAVAPNDDIVVAGSTFANGQSDNVWLRRYDSDGNDAYPWRTEYNSPNYQSDAAYGVAVDADGNVAVGGFETRSEVGEARNTWLRYVVP